jgi:hypothetical protein
MPSTDLVASTDPLFVFIDESGNFDFSEKGTRHFVLSAHITRTPIECGAGLSALTYEFLARGLINQVPIHATQNSVSTRHLAISRLCERTHQCRALSVFVEKATLEEDCQSDVTMYWISAVALVGRLASTITDQSPRIILLFDATLTSKKRAAFLKVLKAGLKKATREFHIHFRPVSHDVNGQIADYYAWSVFRALESNDSYWLAKLPGPHEIFPVTKNDHPA